MIHRVSANQGSFHAAEFRPGFNVILADRTEESSEKDSRNGLGKTTLIEIMKFCLGSAVRKGEGLPASGLDDWVFTTELRIGEQSLVVSRSVKEPRRVSVSGEIPAAVLSASIGDDRGSVILSVDDWARALGELCFGLGSESGAPKYAPTYRSLISHFVRLGTGAFLDPFEVYPRQKTHQTQIENAFLLDLSWEDAREWQLLRDRRATNESLRKAHKSGALPTEGKTLGELNALRVRLVTQSARVGESLSSFKVHERYRDVESAANTLTTQVHELVEANVGDRRLIDLYERATTQEQTPDSEQVARMFASAQVALPEAALKRLDQVQSFHQQIVSNRKAFLDTELERLRAAVQSRDERIAKLTALRAQHLSILQTHGALEEYSRLQAQHTAVAMELSRVESHIAMLKNAEAGAGALKVEVGQLERRTRSDYEERRASLDRGIALFNDYSQELYESAGDLVVDVGSNGLTFKVEIANAGSKGVEQMKIFCYDLTLATLWSYRSPSPKLLVHDSAIFADVDERQIAAALQLAARVSAEHGFTYVCALNSDKVPRDLFAPSFAFDSFVRVRLTDREDAGRLLGIRFERNGRGPDVNLDAADGE